jgi:hypothetical protein
VVRYQRVRGWRTGALGAALNFAKVQTDQTELVLELEAPLRGAGCCSRQEKQRRRTQRAPGSS